MSLVSGNFAQFGTLSWRVAGFRELFIFLMQILDWLRADDVFGFCVSVSCFKFTPAGVANPEHLFLCVVKGN